MLPQLTVYAKILYLLMVVISGALCSDYVIMSKCAHNKFLQIDYEGKVSVQDIPQNITIEGPKDFIVRQTFHITLFAKETQMYLCFNNHWRLIGMKNPTEKCHFNETIAHGYFEFRSVNDSHRRVGFTHRGKPVGPKKFVNDDCYHFTKLNASLFSRTHSTTPVAATGSNNGHSNSNSVSGSSNSHTRHSSSSSSNLNNAKKSSTVIPQRRRHRHNSTRIGPKRLHNSLEHHNGDTRLRHQQTTVVAPVEASGAGRRRKKKKTAKHSHQTRSQYLNPKDPEHRRIVFEQHEHQQRQQRHHHERHHPQIQQYENVGEGDIYPNIQDEYSNDDASAIPRDLSNNLDSSTEYPYSSSSSVSGSPKHRSNYNKKYLSHGSPNHKRVASSHLSSPSSSDGSSAASNVDVVTINRSSNYHSELDGQAARRHYRKSNPALVAASYQSTVVGDGLSPSHRDSTLVDGKAATINLGKMKTNQKDNKNVVRLRKKVPIGS